MKNQGRYTVTGVIFLVIIVLLAVQLFNLQLVKGEAYLDNAQNFSRKEIRLTGERGKILDCNGLPLAYNKTSYTLEFVRDPNSTNKEDRVAYSKGILKAVQIVEQNGGNFLSTFAIRKMDDGTFDFYWPTIDKEKSQKAYEARVKEWKDLHCSKAKNIDKTGTPEQIFNQYRAYYEIPAEASYDEAYKVMSVWQEIRTSFYSSYVPITLAKGINMKTVAMIERDAIDMPGLQISQSSSRVYPNKTMAAHIIGYLGRMTDEPTIVEYKGKGYKGDDLIGVAGIEAYKEADLSGNTNERTGLQVVEVNNLGKVARVIESDNKSPKNGNNVILTIDSKLQKRLEEALAENIAQIRAAQETKYRDNKKKYDEWLQDRVDKNIHYAEVGAAVVMDVENGEVLAMASYPSYDLNLFNGGLGISSEDFKLLTDDNTNPLFNNAISSRGTPGSVFKMATGLAGLMENKIKPEDKIDDEGPYIKHLQAGHEDEGPTCWVAPRYYKHEGQDIVKAIKNSCNFYFFTVADALGVELLNKWADLLGLTSKTNIELPNEVTSQVGSQAALYSKDHMSGVAALVKKKIISLMKETCGKANLTYSDEKYSETAIMLMDIVNAGLAEWGPDTRAILRNELKLSNADIMKLTTDGMSLDSSITASLNEIKWNRGMTIEAGIGQSVTLVTPIAMARYVSALVNGGDVFEARLVKSVITPEGVVQATQPKLIRNLGVPDLYLQKIREGMADVVSEEEEGTAAAFFENYEYKDQIGGKTGTAEVSQTIDLENNSWFVAYAPKDKPEIAVVVYIPSGYQGAMSSYTAKEIVKYYLDMKYKKETPDELPNVNTLVR